MGDLSRRGFLGSVGMGYQERMPSRRDVLKAGGVLAGGLVTATALPSLATAEPAGVDAWSRLPSVFWPISTPWFPFRTFDIRRFGAVGDGVTDCTAAFRAAIATCHRAGECYNYSPFIYAFGQRNIAITGRGTLDDQARQGVWESWYRTSGLQSADQDGHRIGVPSQNILVTDCLFSGRWGGITIGSEMSGGVRNVLAQHCVINISMDQMSLDGARGVLNFVGIETDPMSHIRLSDSAFTRVANPNIIEFVDDLVMRNVTINGRVAE